MNKQINSQKCFVFLHMLSKIKIKNYALIHELEISFESGFSCVTGETGAGKSIILGALGLTLGDRVDTKVLNDNSSKCVIETWFVIKDLSLESFFEKNELDFEVETILRREILPSGKSRAFINDTPVSLSILKLLSEKLIDVHSQHQILLLNSNQFQLKLVDTNASNEVIYASYLETFNAYKETEKELSLLVEKEVKLKADQDYFQFQFDELEGINLEGLEEEELKEELDLLNNSEEIKSQLIQSISTLEDEMGVISQLQSVENSLVKIANSGKRIGELQERLTSALIELQDILSDVRDTNEEIVFDQARIDELTGQLNTLYNLHQKHRTQSVSELIEIKTKLESNLLLATGFDSEKERLQNIKNELFSELTHKANELTDSRKAVVSTIEKEVEEMLKNLAMENAQLKIEIEESDSFGIQGKDAVNFLFRANKGSSFNPISKVASGGELSRLMLSVKTNLASKKQLPTLIFDEIDTGVSGDVASKMGEMMKQIGGTSQVISITHLPQIASKGNSHYKVFKKEEADTTVTKMMKLDYESRVVELAKMLSGVSISDAALENAKSLLAN